MYKVLVAEDEELILKGIQNIIDWEALGLKIIHAVHDGEEALRRYSEEPADIVVTDINMPKLGGLSLIEKIKKRDDRTRVLILSGYDEFEYARTAIRLGVDNYILKPIDEEQLEDALKQAVERLKELDAQSSEVLNQNIKFVQLLSGKMEKEEASEYLNHLGFPPEGACFSLIRMKFDFNSLGEVQIADVLTFLQENSRADEVEAFFCNQDEIILIFDAGLKNENEEHGQTKKEDTIRAYFAVLQNKVESFFDILTFLTISSVYENFIEIPAAYKETQRLQKYLIIEGYGSCIDSGYIENRSSKDITIDTSYLQKLVLGKDKENAVQYMEDLFINNVKDETLSADSIFQVSMKIAMLLQEIIEEYQLGAKENLKKLSEIMEELYRAEDIFAIKTMFIAEITEIIEYLHTEDSQFTPVVRQIISEVKNNYKEDMNLKTLAHKYNMNTSYLGQIFQKEVGCSFSQYLSNTKNSIAKDLILNTNMRIHDIAAAVGYPDTSYFYRKFKQCYGVSPASLREIKKY